MSHKSRGLFVHPPYKDSIIILSTKKKIKKSSINFHLFLNPSDSKGFRSKIFVDLFQCLGIRGDIILHLFAYGFVQSLLEETNGISR